MTRPWQFFAACKGIDSDVFFPPSGRGSSNIAKSICVTCSVCVICREEHMHEQYGVWGGLSESDRERIRRERKSHVINRVASPKLTPAEVREIRLLIAEGNNKTIIAELFKVSRSAIEHIESGKNWAWLDSCG